MHSLLENEGAAVTAAESTPAATAVPMAADPAAAAGISPWFLVGAGIVIEKAYQNGGELVRKKGIRVESLARIESMTVEDGIRFCR